MRYFAGFLLLFWGAILVVVWAYVFQRFTSNKPHKIIFFNSSLVKIFFAVSLWCLLEKFWSFGSLWWTSLSFTQSPYNLSILQLLKFSGTTIITALILLVNCLLAEALIHLIKYRNQVQFTNFFICAFVILCTSHILGFYLYKSPIVNEPDQQIKIGLIQGNIPNEIKLYDPGLETAIENYSKGYQELAKNNLDVILTPETALPFFYQQIANDSSFYPLIKEEKIPIILGAFKWLDRHSYQNSLFTISGEGKVISRYDKIKLVPLGEYIPFKQILGDFISRLSPLDTHLIPGNKEQILTTPFGKAIAGICYDSAFSEIFRQQTLKGGEFIVTAANNAHYSNIMPRQHHAQDVMRAIETDRWMARATNTGYSAIVDPHGNTIWISQINQYQTHEDIIYRRDNLTFYVATGDWLIILFAGFIFLYLMITFLSDE